jgi:hypothetical protein
MAISDYEPHEAAAIVLDYKLEELNEGQIEQISHNMLIDKVCEEYPEIHMQANVPCKSIAFQSLQRKVS